MQTSFLPPTTVLQNGSGVVSWQNPDYIFYADENYAVSSGPTNVMMVGNFNHNLPQGAQVTNIILRVKGYRGTFNTTLNIYAVDNTTGVELSYPYMPPFQGFDGTNDLYVLTPTLFGTTWTVDQINNIKFKLIADGELYLDTIDCAVQYVPVDAPVTPSIDTGEIVCDEFVQGQRFTVAQSFTSSALYFYATSFNYPNGDPIFYADFYGNALLTLDQGVPGLEENVRITNVIHDYNGTGLVRIEFTSLANRGLKFKYPYDADTNNRRSHSGTAEFVISNSAPFYDRFLKKCQIDALVSAPITVQDEGVDVTTSLHTMNVTGAGASLTADPSDPTHGVILNIPGNGVNPPSVSSTSSSTSGSTQVASRTWEHVSSGLNRLLVVQVETEASATVTGVTYNGVALTQEVSTTNGTLRNEQWILVAPPVGTYNIVVSVSPNALITAGAETFNGVNQSTPTGATQTATGTSVAPSLVLNTTVDNSIVVDSIVTAATPIVYTVGAGQTENWKITANTSTRQGASSVEPAGSQPDAVTMSWSITQSTPWALTALEIIGISSPIPPSSDEKVKATSADTTPGYLDDKISLVAGANITINKTIINPGANEEIEYEIESTGSGGAALGVWSTPISNNTPWQATSDGFVVAWSEGLGGSPFVNSIQIFTDSSPTPTTKRASTDNGGTINNGSGNHINAMCPVRNGDYVTVTINNTFPSNSSAIYWIPLS